jgi:dUTP pyrophosphatase
MGYIIKPKALVYKAHPDAILPVRKSSKAAAYDLCTIEDFTLEPGERIIVSTGLIIQPPAGHHIEIAIRSGLAAKYGLYLTNGLAIIDEDYCGPEDIFKLMISRPILANMTKDQYGETPFELSWPLEIKKGDRVAQMVFRETVSCDFEEISKPPTEHDRGGLGSTGMR